VASPPPLDNCRSPHSTAKIPQPGRPRRATRSKLLLALHLQTTVYEADSMQVERLENKSKKMLAFDMVL
jgi:hypothetical protein